MNIKHEKGLQEPVKLLNKMGYTETRKSMNHIRFTRKSEAGNHDVTILRKIPLKTKNFMKILLDVARNAGITNKQLIEKLFNN